MWCYITKNVVEYICSIHVENPKNIEFGVIPICFYQGKRENAEKIIHATTFLQEFLKMCKECK